MEAILRIPILSEGSSTSCGTDVVISKVHPQLYSIVRSLSTSESRWRAVQLGRRCEAALKVLKQHLVSTPVLPCPDFSQPILRVLVWGWFLCWKRIVKTWVGLRKFSTTEKEYRAVNFAIEKLRPYLEGTKITVVPYSLKWLFNIKYNVGIIASWALRLQQYDFEIVHRPGKNNLIPDASYRPEPVIDAVDTQHTDPEPTTDKWY